MGLKRPSTAEFRRTIYDYYRQHKRFFVWREHPEPYFVFVSEVMLQQTQTHRVAPKFDSFIAQFPDFQTLAAASLHSVLAAWQGLGYNRRGKYLHESAKRIGNEFAGQLPDDPKVLVTFPGIGKATAASVCAFAFNVPAIFIETNIRAVFIHFFFSDRNDLHDDELLPLIEQTVDRANPREWYYALMDYGVMLKKTCKNPSRKSKHHNIQSKFEGSDRQIRGMILRALLREPHSRVQLHVAIDREDKRIDAMLTDLCSEGLIAQLGDQFRIC